MGFTSMISEEHAITLAEEKAQEDFPAYQPGPVLSASDEQGCYYIWLRLYQYPQPSPLDVLYGVYRSGHAFVATLFDAYPHKTMSEDEQALQSAADHLIHDFPAISILDVSISPQHPPDPAVKADRWNILISFRRTLDWSMAIADYEVCHDLEGFHPRRIEIDEITKGYVRRPSGTMHAHHRCAKAKPTKHP
jgi:hypothetical protein